MVLFCDNGWIPFQIWYCFVSSDFCGTCIFCLCSIYMFWVFPDWICGHLQICSFLKSGNVLFFSLCRFLLSKNAQSPRFKNINFICQILTVNSWFWIAIRQVQAAVSFRRSRSLSTIAWYIIIHRYDILLIFKQQIRRVCIHYLSNYTIKWFIFHHQWLICKYNVDELFMIRSKFKRHFEYLSQ